MPLEKSIVLGIDVGTANLRAAVFHQGSIKPLPISGQPTLPAYIGMTKTGHFVVGEEARSVLSIDPQRAIFYPSMFSCIGLDQADKIICENGFLFEIKQNEGNWHFVLRSEKAAYVSATTAMKHLFEYAQDCLASLLQNFHISGCVLTDKYDENDMLMQVRRNELIGAAQCFGCGQVYVLDDHIAALFGYAVRSMEDEQQVKSLVLVDLGASTKRIWHFKFNGSLTVDQSCLDSLPGGIDIDSWFLHHVEEVAPNVRQKLRMDCENAKMECDEYDHFTLPGHGTFTFVEKVEELSRKICAAIRPMAMQSATPIRILLTGGSSQLTGLKQAISGDFPGCVIESVHNYAETVTVSGAAACAHVLGALSPSLRGRILPVLNDIIRDNCLRLSMFVRQNMPMEMYEEELAEMLAW